jgi:hypothetical protein
MSKQPTKTAEPKVQTINTAPSVARLNAKPSTELAPLSKPAPLPVASADEFEEHSGAGLETVNSSDMLIPRLGIIQKLSPQLDKAEPEFIEGAKEGDICDIGMGQLFPDGAIFLPVLYRKNWLEWAPRSTGKGLIQTHDTDALLSTCTQNEKKQWVLKNGNLLIETAQWFGFNLSADQRQCFIPMASSQLKRSKKWIALATSEKLKRGDGSEFIAPLWYRAYNLSTLPESNEEGKWLGWKVERSMNIMELQSAGIVHNWKDLKLRALDFFELLSTGKATADNSTIEAAVNIEAARNSGAM